MKYCSLLFCLFLLWSCGQNANQPENPAAPGFNQANSDAKAIALADAVMEAQGGRQAWDETRFLDWNFFGRRRLLWDKQENKVRILASARRELETLANNPAQVISALLALVDFQQRLHQVGVVTLV